jgi:hypothetical protein
MTNGLMSLELCHPERSEGSTGKPKGVNRPRKRNTADTMLEDSSLLSE